MNQAEKSKLGALRRYDLYGNLGTSEGRSKGGSRTCGFFNLHPEAARKSGFVIKKEIKIPSRTPDLANFIGVMLGDGGIRSSYQFTISFNYKTDLEYAEYIGRLIRRLFAVGHVIHKRKNSLGADIVVSSASMVKFLLEHGLKKGSKVKNQIDIPSWVKKDKEFKKACLRGLFDTDGSLYRHRYRVNNKWYEYLKLDFTNCSRPLLNSAFAILTDLGIKANLSGVHITISAKKELNKYFSKVGSSNSKFFYKWQRF